MVNVQLRFSTILPGFLVRAAKGVGSVSCKCFLRSAHSQIGMVKAFIKDIDSLEACIIIPLAE